MTPTICVVAIAQRQARRPGPTRAAPSRARRASRACSAAPRRSAAPPRPAGAARARPRGRAARTRVLPTRLARIGEPEPRRHRVVRADEPAARVLEVDRVGDAREQAVEQIALVEERVLRGLEAAHVDEREHDAVDRCPSRGTAACAGRTRARAIARARARPARRVASTASRSSTSSGWSMLCVNVSIERPTSCGSRLKLSAICGVNLRIRSCAVEEDRADLGARQQVVHVVGELGQLGDLALVLGVDRVELLVDALELLVRALQLLVRGDAAPRSPPAAPRCWSRAPRSRPAGSPSCSRARPRARRAARARPASSVDLGRASASAAALASSALERDRGRAASRRCAAATRRIGDAVQRLVAARRAMRTLLNTIADGSLERALRARRRAPSSARRRRSSRTSSPGRPSRELQEAARAAERVDELAALVDEQARRHELVEQRVVGRRAAATASSARTRRRRRGARARGSPCARGCRRGVDRHAHVAVLPVDAASACRRSRSRWTSGPASRSGRGTARRRGCSAKWNRRQHLLLRRRLEVDEHVAAADEIDARERRVLDHVVRREHDHLAELGDDLVAVAAPR